jgi:hypothetical protein
MKIPCVPQGVPPVYLRCTSVPKYPVYDGTVGLSTACGYITFLLNIITVGTFQLPITYIEGQNTLCTPLYHLEGKSGRF